MRVLCGQRYAYACLKAINDAGQSLHTDKPELAHRYNLSILHRHAGKKKVKPELAPKA
ncbi:hypothetical protein HY768_05935 [candidate division TA06 bacterium]|uniref:Uncharacterized protein n=1 Tax=candidate division TA06 bacterium TaxID=2250710 RepID=A0A933IBF2_UNCT6|nr:hypothetical protein [candidate division TA06 bacterium]